jgi:hypothetical protein
MSHIRGMNGIRLCALLTLTCLTAFAQDSTPPEVTAFRISPAVVDVTNGPAEVVLEFDITDDISGFDYLRIDMLFEETRLKLGMTSANIVEGTILNGTYRTTLTIPQGSPPGVRRFELSVYDGVDNRDILLFNNTLTVQVNGPFDQEKPVIRSITIEPSVVDLSEGPVRVNISIEVSDDFSGIPSLWADIRPVDPEAATLWFSNRRFFDVTEGSETATVEYSALFSEYTESGEWELLIENFGDGAGRASEYVNASKLREDFNTTFTVVNPNGDGNPPELLSLEFEETVANPTFETSFLPWTVQFTDDISGIWAASIYVYPPAGTSGQYLHSVVFHDDQDGIDLNNGVLQGVLEVPRFVVEGEHRIQVVLEDIAGNRRGFGQNSDTPLPAGSPEFITVAESAGADITDMIVTDVKVTPETIDISNGTQTVSMEISFTDDRSGLDYMSYTVDDPNGDSFERIRLTTDDLIAGTPVSGTVMATFEVPQYSLPGEYRFEGLTLRDQAENNFSDFIFPIFPVGMPASLNVVNNGPVETEPPEILSVSMPQTTYTLNGDSLSVPITVEAEDDLTGVAEVRIIYRHPEDSDSSLLFIMQAPRDVSSESGTVRTFEDTGILGEFEWPGTYGLTQVKVEDAFGLEREYDVGDPANLPPGLPAEITVINNGSVDLEPPEIIDVRLSATSFDVTNALGNLEVEIDFTDDVAGLWDLVITMRNTDEFYSIPLLNELYRDGNLNLISGDLNQGTLRQLLTIPRYIPEGEYRMTVEIADRALRDTSVNPIADNGTLTVLNAGPVDRTDPQLIGLRFDSVVDVTDGPASFPMAAEVIDDLAGINYFYIIAQSPSENDFDNYVERPQSFDYPSLTDIQFPITLEIPAFAEPGEWTVEVSIRDANGARVSLDATDIDRLGFPSTFTVINNQPPGYLWKESDEVEPDGWRKVDWFGWVQDQGDYPLVYHLEHGFIVTAGSDLEQFFFYDNALAFWWWISEATYPWLWAFTGTESAGWYYYYAPFGRPGQRFFLNPLTGISLPETELFN